MYYTCFVTAISDDLLPRPTFQGGGRYSLCRLCQLRVHFNQIGKGGAVTADILQLTPLVAAARQ